MMFRTAATSVLLAASLCGASADLAQIRTVYVLPMSNGLDQYLANHLTAQGFYQVVTDPKLADAVMTDQIGTAFETRMADLLPPEKPAGPQAAEDDSKLSPAEREEKEAARAVERFKAGNYTVQRVSTFGRGRGNVFLVEVKSRRVVWSAYEPARRVQPDDLDKTSIRVVERLRRDVKGEPKAK